ncbi:MAG TPA: acyl-CoA dehydrogenase family protein [Solirubrobacteraceae bacterium]|nr:acyl-CoA dehydrogenase family protein [Solirubrobacteraceae bacterium]
MTTISQTIRYSPPATPFALPPELEELKLLAREIVNRECIPLESEFLTDACPDEQGVNHGQYEIDGSLPKARWDRLREISENTGLYRACLPDELGGMGFGVLGAVVLAEEINRSIVELPTALLPPVLLECNDDQAERYLEPIITREATVAFAQTEPDAGSDPGNGMRTRAVCKGEDWILNGVKTFITDADRASTIMTLAVTDQSLRQRGGITMFLVDRHAPGVTVTPLRTWLAARVHQYTVYYDDVRVPAEDVLGEVGGGFSLGQQWLAISDRLTRGSLAAGILSRGLELAREWVQGRETFGAPLSDRQAIQWMLVDVLVDLKCIRAAAYECAARADAGEDVRTYAALAKFIGANWGHRSVDRLMQIFGGIGESSEHPIPHWYRLLRHGRIGGGTDEIQRMLMARAILKHGPRLWQA